MNENIRVKIVTPTTIILDKESSMVTMPGELGEFGVLPSHELLIVSLKMGFAKISVNNQILKYFIDKGVAEITGASINVVTAFAIDVSELKMDEVATKIIILKQEIAQEIDNIKANIIKLNITRYESLLDYMKVAL